MSRDAPSDDAAASNRRSRPASAPSTVITRNGMATNTLAATTPQIENGSRNPVASSSGSPMRPRRPNAKSSAAPPTTGGNTIGSVTTARSTDRPGKSVRASSHASGTPSTTEMTAETDDVTSESSSASTTIGCDTSSVSRLHGVRLSSPTRGSTKTAAPRTPNTMSTGGTLVRTRRVSVTWRIRSGREPIARLARA